MNPVVKSVEKNVEMQRISASSTQFRETNTKPILSDSDSSSCSGTDSNDSNDGLNWKRSKVTKKRKEEEKANSYDASCDRSKFAAASQIFQNLQTTRQSSKKAVDKFSVWSNVLQERSLAEDLSSVEVLQRDYLLDSRRECESYDYTLKYGAEGRQTSPHEVHRRLGLKRSKKEREGTQLPMLNRNKRSFEVKEDDSDEMVATAIATILREPKGDLIGRVVNTLGTKKSLELLRMTEDIEEAGGLMTIDNSRRRTPGGVFLQLLRTDHHVTKMDKDKIFELEREEQVKAKKGFNKSKRRRKVLDMAKAKKEATESEPMLTSLPTLSDLLTNKALAESDKMEAHSESDKEPGELDSSEDDSNDVPLI